MLFPSPFLVSLVLAAQAGGTAPAARPVPGPEPTFIITTGGDQATLAMAADNQDTAIVTVLELTGKPVENGRLNDRKNGLYTGLEQTTLAPSTSFKIVISAFRTVAASRLVLTTLDRSATFTLAATANLPDVIIKNISGAKILKLAEDGQSLMVAGPDPQ